MATLHWPSYNITIRVFKTLLFSYFINQHKNNIYWKNTFASLARWTTLMELYVSLHNEEKRTSEPL